MANKALFKPFAHDRLGPLYVDRTIHSANAVAIAAERIEKAFAQETQPTIDIALSLGGCVKRSTKTSVQTSQDFDGDTSWQEFLESKRAQSLAAAITRLQIEMNEVPHVDELSAINRIQAMVKSHINPNEIRVVAARLFASLFYVDSDGTADEQPDGGYLIPSKRIRGVFITDTNFAQFKFFVDCRTTAKKFMR